MSNLLCGQDWANLNYYKSENSLLGPPSENEQRIVFLGNSITEGWNQFLPEFFENKSYVNRGISGQTTQQMLLRFRQDVINLDPQVVIILAGTNDIAENTGPITLDEILQNIISMVELAEANQIKSVLCSVIPAFDFPWNKGLKPNEKISALNKLISNYAATNNLIYIDYYLEMVDNNNGLISELTYDGVHPNKKGYEVMATIFNEAINEILTK